MRARTLQTWIARRLAIRQRLERVCTRYLLFVMVVTQQHALEEAARFSGRHQAQCGKMLQSHATVAISTLERLSKKQATQCAKALQDWTGLPWTMAIIMESTLQHRASLPPEHAKTFKHGKGYVIGHPWTNIVLILHGLLMPLRPIPYYSKSYCLAHALDDQTEQELVVAYLST